MQFSNPFDNPQGQFYLLQNAQQQFSLWPQSVSLQDGWIIICEPQSRQACDDWLTAHWTTLKPAHFAR